MYVLSTDTPTIVRTRPERHVLAVARINRLDLNAVKFEQVSSFTVMAMWALARSSVCSETRPKYYYYYYVQFQLMQQ